ncbi:hypothetical protein B0H14DRAFT_2576732 [Mycena olivaceomarginata]|nr:hypothetical protein B0H14DRAFT_2576732 [Mycena olivaceomarginata]
MDATTVLGTRVNEGEWWGMGEPPMQNEPCVGVKSPNTICPLGKPEDRGWMGTAQGPRKRAPWDIKAPKRAAQVQYQATPYAPLGRPEDRGWMGTAQGPRKRALWGIKSPKTGCASAVPGNTICPPGQARG